MNDEIKELLDFKENADYKKLSCDEIAILRDYITNLQQENERLELLNDELELYNIINKAVEYIKEHEYDIRNNFDYYVKGSKLLNILNGSDNNDN